MNGLGRSVQQKALTRTHTYSEKQYKDRFAAWKISKNVRTVDMMHLCWLKLEAAGGEGFEFKVHGMTVEPRKVDRFIGRMTRRLGRERLLALIRSQSELHWAAECTSTTNVLCSRHPSVYNIPGGQGVTACDVTRDWQLASRNFAQGRTVGGSYLNGGKKAEQPSTT